MTIPSPPSSFTLGDFDFALPPELIAQHPTPERSGSRLLDGSGEQAQDRRFRDLPDLLREGDLLVVNDTRVVKARLLGAKASGGAVEVTNKAERFALPLTEALGLRAHAVAVIGGDTTPHTKPHPAPLLEAARRAGVNPLHCIYVGDDERDVIAGQAAGMATAAAAWGYLGQGKPVGDWGADAVLASPLAVLPLLGIG